MAERYLKVSRQLKCQHNYFIAVPLINNATGEKEDNLDMVDDKEMDDILKEVDQQTENIDPTARKQDDIKESTDDLNFMKGSPAGTSSKVNDGTPL